MLVLCIVNLVNLPNTIVSFTVVNKISLVPFSLIQIFEDLQKSQIWIVLDGSFLRWWLYKTNLVIFAKKILKLAKLFIAFTKCFSMNLVSQSNIFVPMQKITSILVSIRILKKKGLFMSSSMMTLHDKMGWWPKDRHLLNVTRSLLYQMNVLKHFQKGSCSHCCQPH